MSRACGLSRKAIAKGIEEIKSGTVPPAGRIRRAGAGRKKITEQDSGLVQALESLITPDTRGDPESPLRWTCKSARTLAAELTWQKHPVSHMTVTRLLHDMGYSLQSNRKMEEGADHPDRCKEILGQVIEKTQNETIRGQAQDVIKQLKGAEAAPQ